MKVSVLNPNLLDALKRLKKYAPGEKSTPVYLSTEDSRLNLSVFNARRNSTYCVHIGAKVDIPGSTELRYHDILECAALMSKDGRVDLVSAEHENFKLTATGNYMIQNTVVTGIVPSIKVIDAVGQCSFNMVQAIDAAAIEFDIKGAAPIEDLDAVDLSPEHAKVCDALLKAAKLFTVNESSRPGLTTVWHSQNSLYASDGFSLFHTDLSAIEGLYDALKLPSEDSDGAIIVNPKVDRNGHSFPFATCNDILPIQENAQAIELYASDLLAFCNKTIKAGKEDKSTWANLTVKDGALYLRSKFISSDADYRPELTDTEISFNACFMRDALKLAGKDTRVTLHISARDERMHVTYDYMSAKKNGYIIPVHVVIMPDVGYKNCQVPEFVERNHPAETSNAIVPVTSAVTIIESTYRLRKPYARLSPEWETRIMDQNLLYLVGRALDYAAVYALAEYELEYA